MGSWSQNPISSESDPLAPQPHVWLEQTQHLLGTSSPDANQVAAALANLHEELTRYFEARSATADDIEAALPYTAPHVTRQGEALLHSQHVLLEASERLACELYQTPPSQHDALWWAKIRTQCEALAAKLLEYESRSTLPPREEDRSLSDKYLRRIDE